MLFSLIFYFDILVMEGIIIIDVIYFLHVII